MKQKAAILMNTFFGKGRKKNRLYMYNREIYCFEFQLKHMTNYSKNFEIVKLFLLRSFATFILFFVLRFLLLLFWLTQKEYTNRK